MSAYSPTLSALIGLKGLANIAVALTLLYKPELVYLGPAARSLHAYTGLRLSDAKLAPGFHHACALLALSVGVGQLYGSRTSDVRVLSAFVLMNGVWGVSTLATCLFKPESGSATVLFSGLIDSALTLVCFVVAGRPLLQAFGITATEGRIPSEKDL